MDTEFDLFGNPYDVGPRKAGRPEHEPTEENIINIMVLLASGMTNREVAKTVGISVPTLRKHYLHLTKNRAVLLARLKARLRTAQIQQGLAGNAAALSASLRMLDTVSAERVSRDLQDKVANQPAARGYVSKKDQRLENAQAIGGKYAVPSAPRLVASNGHAVAVDGEQ
jgi:predicted ArsR family transcriptional regulator